MPLRDFQLLHKLGKGTFGTVYKVRRHEDKQLYADEARVTAMACPMWRSPTP